MRAAGKPDTGHHADTLGGRTGKDPLPIGLVVVTAYRPGARWQPRPRSAGEGVVALLANTVPAQERPAGALAAIRRAVTGALVLEGERGEASAIVDELLERVPGSTP